MDVRKNHDVFDLTKFILCLFIVALHSNIVPSILSPCVRIAVPLFFMISSYLFFERKRRIIDTSRGGGRYRFVKRNLKLYVFWSIVLLPLTMVYDIYTYSISEIKNPLWMIFVDSLRKILFSGFPASWYIIASIIAILILYRIPSKYNLIMLLTSFSLYLICCISSNYYNLFDAGSPIIRFIEIFRLFFNAPHLSFLVAFIWMGIGKTYAESEITIEPIVNGSGIILSAILLYVEYFVIKSFSLSNADDCYILLVPLCFFIFNALKNANRLKVKDAISLRKASTIIYCSHKTVIRIFSFTGKYIFHFRIDVLVFVLTVITVLIGSYFVFKLESTKHFKWLKYSY